eukprot:tig00000388_g24802.t1
MAGLQTALDTVSIIFSPAQTRARAEGSELEAGPSVLSSPDVPIETSPGGCTLAPATLEALRAKHSSRSSSVRASLDASAAASSRISTSRGRYGSDEGDEARRLARAGDAEGSDGDVAVSRGSPVQIRRRRRRGDAVPQSSSASSVVRRSLEPALSSHSRSSVAAPGQQQQALGHAREWQDGVRRSAPERRQALRESGELERGVFEELERQRSQLAELQEQIGALAGALPADTRAPRVRAVAAEEALGPRPLPARPRSAPASSASGPPAVPACTSAAPISFGMVHAGRAAARALDVRNGGASAVLVLLTVERVRETLLSPEGPGAPGPALLPPPPQAPFRVEPAAVAVPAGGVARVRVLFAPARGPPSGDSLLGTAAELSVRTVHDGAPEPGAALTLVPLHGLCLPPDAAPASDLGPAPAAGLDAPSTAPELFLPPSAPAIAPIAPSEAPAPEPQPEVHAQVPVSLLSCDFGAVTLGSRPERLVSIRNQAGRPLLLRCSLAAGCDAFAIPGGLLAVPVAGSVQLPVAFAAARAGAFADTLSVADEAGPVTLVQLSARATAPAWTVEPGAEVEFGVVPHDASASARLALANPSPAPWAAVTLGPGESRELEVRFAAAGYDAQRERALRHYEALLTVATAAECAVEEGPLPAARLRVVASAGHARLQLPRRLVDSGVRFAAPASQADLAPHLLPPTARLALPVRNAGTLAAAVLATCSEGPFRLLLPGGEGEGASRAAFSVRPGELFRLPLAFCPRLPGRYSAALTLSLATGPEGKGPRLRVRLEGVGGPAPGPALLVDRPVVSFGGLPVGASALRRLALRNEDACRPCAVRLALLRHAGPGERPFALAGPAELLLQPGADAFVPSTSGPRPPPRTAPPSPSTPPPAAPTGPAPGPAPPREYRVPLLGYGGVADVQLWPAAPAAGASLAFRLQGAGARTLPLTLRNVGERWAFLLPVPRQEREGRGGPAAASAPSFAPGAVSRLCRRRGPGAGSLRAPRGRA